MSSKVVISLILVCCFLWVTYTLPVALSCDSCGKECASACGTRHFRSCCFNYLRKRSGSPILNLPPSPGLKLELWLEKSQIERAARSALVEETEKIQQSLQQQQQQQQQQLQLRQPNEPNFKAMEAMDGGRLQLIYDA